MALAPTSDTSEPLSQADLKDSMAGHLGAKCPPVDPKSRFIPLDTLANYDCRINSLQPRVRKAQDLFTRQTPSKRLWSKPGKEPRHYRGLADFLNRALDSCLQGLGDEASEAMYRSLRFSVWDQPMQDGVDRAHPLKPDLAGALGIMEPMSLWRSPPLGEDGMKAATYARALFSANPFDNSFWLLGGLTASTPLKLDSKLGQQNLILLLSAILTWQTAEDAGFPAWCNEGRVYLTKIHPSLFTIDRILHPTSCIRGRAPRVYHIRIPHPTSPEPLAGADVAVPDKPRGSNPLPVPRQSRAGLVLGVKHGSEGGRVMKVLTEGLARMSLRIGRLKGKRSILREDDRSDSEIASIQISRDVATKSSLSATCTPDSISWNGLTGDQLKVGDCAVLKLSWIPGRGPHHQPGEPELLETCGGMFGVPHHYYSFLAYHKTNCPTPNHLFLPSDPSDTDQNLHWNVFKRLLAALWYQQKIFHPWSVAIAHAQLGYYKMCQKGFQHRDISIGNVLIVDEPIETQPFQITDPNEIQSQTESRRVYTDHW
ncbi:hypothetical protein D9757_012670 [Collybiopsis confluens]|uniref:Uncharacterized protein n=1 Tax=Collybiopsis confluens TaxID=2823264 RepID=A0A8H5LQN0_9AGAR|nr:hypothetical protein D9757_012670 [Collybiopsis confluens]